MTVKHRRTHWTVLAGVMAGMALLGGCATGMRGDGAGIPDTEFGRFYWGLRQEVAAQGLNPGLMDQAFDGAIAPRGPVLKSEKSQPEVVQSFSGYTSKLLSPTRIANGKIQFAAHRDQLRRLTAETGVPGQVVVALWGIETAYGTITGDHPVIPSLATLAWNSASRPDFYKKELFAALKIAEQQQRDPRSLKGSWAGAMGQCQFMPTSYLAYAVDGDGDGKIDIWTNEDDVLASGANYLKRHGWQAGKPWQITQRGEVDLRGLDINGRGLSTPMPASEWRKRGFVTDAGGQAFGAGDMLRSYQPEDGGPVYLLGPNFSVILRWNNSSYFAWSVLTLADRIADGT